MLFDLKQYRQALHPVWKQKKILQNRSLPEYDQKESSLLSKVMFALLITGLVILGSCRIAHAQELTASWYSVESLKKEGTWRYSHGIMANGHIFSDSGLTCATRLFPLGIMVRVTESLSKHHVDVKVTDRIGKRFAKTRIDLSISAFKRISTPKQGLVTVNVERIL